MTNTHEHKTNGTGRSIDRPLVNDTLYIKDLSFENPGIFSVLGNPGKKPDIQINLQVGVNPLDKNVYEVALSIDIQSKLEDKLSFLIELVYGGVFTITKELPEDEVKKLLLIDAPELIFPFARNLVSNLTQGGGMQALLLNCVDFHTLYTQQQEKAKESVSSQAVN
ncbi:MAG: protein-export chaperone SecB [Alphaproteobacteria bacterium]